MSQGSARTVGNFWALIQGDQPPEVWLELTPVWDQGGQPSGGLLNALTSLMPQGKDSLC